MDNLLDNIDETNDKVENSNKIFNSKTIKWVIWFIGITITVTSSIMYYKYHFIDRLDNIETRVTKNEKRIENIKIDIEKNFRIVNDNINEIYDKALQAFEEYKIYTNKQLNIIVEFGQFDNDINKELLKKMLDLNSVEYSNLILELFSKAKREKKFKPNEMVKLPVYMKFTDLKSGITTYMIEGAPYNYLDTLDTSKYDIIKSEPSEKYPGLFDYVYTKKN